MLKAKLLTVALLLFTAVQAQFNPKLDRFSATHKDGIVYLDWIMHSGSVCLGIVVERSEDSVNFKEIGDISGICGNLTKPVQYYFTDEFPVLNKKMFYRLSFVGFAYSDVITIVAVDVNKDEYSLFPNPAAGMSTLNFYNPKIENHSIIVLNSSGTEVMRLTTTEDKFMIDTERLDAGIYQFLIFNSSYSNTVSGRMVVAH